MKSSYNLLGKNVPFFLNNANLAESHYLYQVYSPSITDDLTPTLSLTKVSENTLAHPVNSTAGNDLDIVAVCTGSKANEKSALNFISTSVKLNDGVIAVGQGDDKLPYILADVTNSGIKSYIIGLRDALRWKNYRFIPGRFIDILWTENEFIVFEICGDKNSMWLVARAAYKTNDTALQDPLNVDLSGITIDTKWSKAPGKVSEMNRAIKQIEWGCFSRRLK